MRMLTVGLTVLAAGVGVSAFAGALSEPVSFADEQYTGWRSGSDTHFYDAVGKWVHGLDDRSDYQTGTGIVVRTGLTPLTFQTLSAKRDKVISTPTNVAVAFAGEMTFTAYRGGEEWEVVSKSEAAALTLKETADGKLVFAVWTFLSTTWGGEQSGRWVDVSNAALAPEEDKMYAVTIEVDQTCRPPRARYTVDNKVLADKNGETWFSSKPTKGVSDIAPDHEPANTISVVGVVGSCKLGKFTLTYRTPQTPRAAVTIARAGSAAPGGTLAPAVTALEGQTVGDALTYQWYRMDATGVRTAIAGATGATYVPTDAELGHWVEVDVSDLDGYAGSGRLWCSAIPVAYIDIDGGEFPDDGDYLGRGQTEGLVRPDYEADCYITGDPSLKDYKKCQYDGRISIHVRGNSTAYQRKKPYKIKLDTKTDVFGLGNGKKSKHWVLLANYNDDSHMRNKLYYDFSEKLGLVAMKSTWVDVIMNGEYIGLYQFCQQIRVAEERINVYEWDTGKIAENTVGIESLGYTSDDENAIDSLLETNCLWMTSGEFTYKGTDFALTSKKADGGILDKKGRMQVYWKAWKKGDISGGYIFEPDEKKISGVGYNPAASNFCQTNDYNGCRNIIHMTLGTPEYGFTNPEVRQYVWDLWAYMSKCWMSGTGYGPDGRHYTETCDFDSMVGYWLIHQIAGNGDSGLHSRYAYQDMGGKVFFGPAWDFDLVGRSVSTITNAADGSFVYKTAGRGSWSPSGQAGNYAGYWTADPYFSYKVREKYLANRDELQKMVEKGGYIDQYKAKLATSAAANDARWMMPFGFAGRGGDIGGVEHLRGYIQNCITWLDKQFASVGMVLTSATKTVGDNNSTTANNLRYVQDKTLAVSFPDATNVPGSPDVAGKTGVADVQQRVLAAGVRMQVAVPQAGAKTLDVYLDGFSNSVQTVTSGKVEFTLPRSLFRAGKTYFLSFTARDADGKRLGQNAALVTAQPGGGIFLMK